MNPKNVRTMAVAAVVIVICLLFSWVQYGGSPSEEQDGGFDGTVERELLTAAHRDYTTAYMLGVNERTVNYADSQAKGDCDYIANVLSCGGGSAVVEMRGRFKVGDVLEVLSPSQSFGSSFKVTAAYLPDGTPVDDCKRVQERYTLPCPVELSPGDILRRRKV